MQGKKEDDKDGGLMYQQLRKFINVIDELRDVGVSQFIKLPRICVLGTQSAGKSSVLESVVGLDFLPRGDGVVTRRPLELRLNHISDKIEPWAKFEEVPNKKFTNFQEVKETINFLTDKICGQKKNIIDKPIVLNIFSHTCPDLTMVDLPGITRIPIDGQDPNIEKVTKGMAARYCGDSRTIILCVLPANADMTTSDGLQMARELDPKGIRTIGVITKIDIMDQGTNAKRMLEGKDVQLRLGFIGIKNRSQQDIMDRISVEAAIEKEQLYFSTHPVYSSMNQSVLGIFNLTSKLTKILFTHIKHSLPDIMKEIRDKVKETDDDLRDLGPPMPSESAEKMQLLWGMVTDFISTYKNAISGKYDSKRYSNPNQTGGRMELSGGAKIKMQFFNLYSEFSNYRATQEYNDMHIQKAIQMHEGDGLPGFPSVDVFIYLINPQLEKLKDPALELIQDSYQQLESIASGIVEKIFQRFPTMIPEMMEIIIKVLSRERERSREVVEAILDSEQEYLFTNDRNYKENRSEIIQNQGGQPGVGAGGPGGPGGQLDQYGQPQQNQQQMRGPQGAQGGGNVFVQELRSRIDDYFSIVLRNVKDSIPKTIGFFLVRKSQDALQFELYNQVNTNKALSSTLGEPKRITERRVALTAVQKTLKDALKVLQRDPDIANNTVGDEELEAALRTQAMEDRRAASSAQDPRGQGQPGMGRGGGQPPMRGGMNPNQRGGMPPGMQQRGGMPPNMQRGGMPPGMQGHGGPPPGHPNNPGMGRGMPQNPNQQRPGGPPGQQPGGGTGNLFGNGNPLGGK